ncbi:MAG TPA: FAD-linked oxidase C-terminal domain-containing protein, partial [Terriglobales bacterium]|nr:FAD-linked oxidase C-terminal domain-containing protein [Terriglobales bacterium]
LVQDGVIPRTQLPRVLAEIERLSKEAGLRVANVFHAGDGNLHPLVLYDRRIEGQEQRALSLAEDILRLCVEAGGSITGEHGVGEEKKQFMPVMFSDADLDAMKRLRSAFDPYELCNPTKMFPGTDTTYQGPIAYEPHPIEKAGLAQRY